MGVYHIRAEQQRCNILKIGQKIRLQDKKIHFNAENNRSSDIYHYFYR